jgi:hypothetical protein
MPMRKAGAILTGLAMLLLPAAAPPPIDDGDAIGSTAEHAAVLAATTAYFEARDKGDYARAYRQIGPSMTAYLTPALYEDAGRRFAAEAGAWQGRVVTRLTWTRDPPEAPRPGLYVAADFTARYVNLELMCGYLMWRKTGNGRFELVREEQNYIDRPAAQAMAPEQRKGLPRLFGCVDRTDDDSH